MSHYVQIRKSGFHQNKGYMRHTQYEPNVSITPSAPQKTEKNQDIVENIVCENLDPLSVMWITRDGITMPILVPAGENPDWSRRRILDAWRLARGKHILPSSSQLSDSWKMISQKIAEEEYGTKEPKEWQAVENAVQQRLNTRCDDTDDSN